MKKQELYDHLSEELKDFTILDFDCENPFGWNYSLKNDKDKVKEEKSAVPYRPEKDRRLKDTLSSKSDPQEKRNHLSAIALCLAVSFSKWCIDSPYSHEMKNLLKIANMTCDEMDDFTLCMDDDELLCFHDPVDTPFSILLYKLIWDTLCEQSGISGWSPEGKKQYPKKKEHPCRNRLNEFLKYARKNNIFVLSLECISKDSYDTAEEKKEILIQNMKAAIKNYESFIKKFITLECKRDICVNESREEKKHLEKEMDRINEAMLRTLKKITDQQDIKAISIPLSKPRKNITDNLLNILQTRKAEDFDLALEDLALPEEFHKFEIQYRKNLRALNTYRKKLIENLKINLNDIVLQRNELIDSCDPYGFAEGMLMAILEDDEIYTLNACNFLANYIGQPLGIPYYTTDYPDLDDEEEWDYARTDPSDMSLVEELIGKNESIVYNSSVPFGSEKLLSGAQLNSIVATYSGFHVDGPIYLRKSVTRAFESLGYDEIKARELAVCVASLNFAREQAQSLSMQRFSSIYEDDSEIDEETASLENIAKLKKEIEQFTFERNESIRKQKQNESENQKLRHALADAERENEQLKLEIETLRKQNRNESVEIRRTPVEQTQNKEDPFPYRTDKNILLFGGFDSFSRGIAELIPDIRFISCTRSRLDLNLFRNADLVFIQINKLSHSNYWAAIEALKKADVPFYHLNSAGPRRCALEMIREIEKLSK